MGILVKPVVVAVMVGVVVVVGVGDVGDEDECGDDADGESGGDDGVAVLVEELGGSDGLFEELVGQ